MMADGLPKPSTTVDIVRNRGKTIDAATDAAVNGPAPAASAPAPAAAPAAKPISVSEAEAKAAKYKADRDAFDATAKGMPKPGLLGRLFGG